MDFLLLFLHKTSYFNHKSLPYTACEEGCPQMPMKTILHFLLETLSPSSRLVVIRSISRPHTQHQDKLAHGHRFIILILVMVKLFRFAQISK